MNGQRTHLNFAFDNQHRTNILGPKHFIVEEENEALLAKELQEAKLQSAHNSHSSMHSSQPQIFPLQSNDFSRKHVTVIPSNFVRTKRISCSCSSAIVFNGSFSITFQIIIFIIRVSIEQRQNPGEVSFE